MLEAAADAVFHVVLARIAAAIPYTMKLPAVIGGPAPLCYFALLVGPPGGGKSSANSVGTELLPVDQNVVADQLPLGSGEGLVEVLFEHVVEEDPVTGKPKKVKRQTKYNAFVYVDEGAVLADLGARNGSTLLPTLRTIWSGKVLGNTNASPDRRRLVPTGQYTYGAIVVLLDSTAADLLRGADAGTPQRFAWGRATDPTIPKQRPDWPGSLAWSPDDVEQDTMHLDPAIVPELQDHHLQVARGHRKVPTLDAHANLLRLKTAALLAILAGRDHVTRSDWHLSGLVKRTSDAVRAMAIQTTRRVAAEHEQQAVTRTVNRTVTTNQAIERQRIVECGTKIATKVQLEPERWMRRKMQQAMRRYRDVFDDGLEHAVAQGWVLEVVEPGQGENKVLLRRGPCTVR
jgi:hypothetical protein